jgi:ElaB/YqjD/DUF883 family membrane-anchored ribosome-binding protein
MVSRPLWHFITNERIDAMTTQPPPVTSANAPRGAEAAALLAATIEIAIAAWDAGTRVAAMIKDGRTARAQAKDTTAIGAKAADRAVRQHPYLAIGVAVCIGAVLGCLCIPQRGDKAD